MWDSAIGQSGELTLMRCWMRSRLTSSISKKILLRRAEMFWLISSSCSFAKSCVATHGSAMPATRLLQRLRSTTSGRWRATRAYWSVGLTLTDSRLSMMQKFSGRASVSYALQAVEFKWPADNIVWHPERHCTSNTQPA